MVFFSSLPLSVPLWLIFVLQSLLVLGTFAAVIAVLTEQQRADFDVALQDRLAAKQREALDKIMAPLEARMQTSRFHAQSYFDMLHHTPALGPNENSTLLSAQHFYDHFYSVATLDPLVQYLSVQHLQGDGASSITANYNNNVSTLLAPLSPRWAMFGFDLQKIVKAFGGVVDVCLSLTPPIVLAACPYRTSQPFDDSILQASQYLRTNPNSDAWAPPGTFLDPASQKRINVITYAVLRGWHPTQNVPLLVMSTTLQIPHIKWTVGNASVSAASAAALFHYSTSSPVSNCVVFTSSGTGISDFNETGLSAADTGGMWPCGQTPNAVLDAVWSAADARCHPDRDGGALDPMAFPCAEAHTSEVTVDGATYVTTAERLVTPERMDLLLVQYTPRAHFYGASEQSRATGIGIGAAAALLVVGTCVTIMGAVRRPIALLRDKMHDAARMRNDNDEKSSGNGALRPLLSELAALAAAFSAMNTKLQQARPFLPQSLLADVASSAASDCDDDDGENTLEGVRSAAGTDAGGGRHSGIFDHGGMAATSFHRSDDDDEASTTYSTHHAHAASDVISCVSAASHRGAPLRWIGATLQVRHVAILRINGKGFHAFAGMVAPQQLQLRGGGPSADAIIALHTALCNSIEHAASQERGIVDGFQGDHFVVTFNAGRPCGMPAKAAARTSLAIVDGYKANTACLSATPSSSSPLHLDGPPSPPLRGLSMGMSAGAALVGNMGTGSIQRLVTVSDAFTEACRLEHVHSKCVAGHTRYRVGGGIGGCCLVAVTATTTGRSVNITAPDIAHIVQLQVVGGIATHCIATSSSSPASISTTATAASHPQPPQSTPCSNTFLPTTHAILTASNSDHNSSSRNLCINPHSRDPTVPPSTSSRLLLVAVITNAHTTQTDHTSHPNHHHFRTEEGWMFYTSPSSSTSPLHGLDAINRVMMEAFEKRRSAPVDATAWQEALLCTSDTENWSSRDDDEGDAANGGHGGGDHVEQAQWLLRRWKATLRSLTAAAIAANDSQALQNALMLPSMDTL